MLSVPLTGTPAVIAVVLGLGGVFVALSQMSRRSALRVLLLTTALGAVAAGGALGLREEATAIALGGKIFLCGIALVCIAAPALLRQLAVSERSLVRTLADGEAAESECERLAAVNADLQAHLDHVRRRLQRADAALCGQDAAALQALEGRVECAELNARRSLAVGDEIFDAVAILDPDSLRIVSFNAGLCRMTGRTSEELTGSLVEDLVHRSPGVLRSFDLRQAAHAGNSVIVPIQSPTGAQVQAELRVGRAGDGDDARVVAILRDISRETALSAEVRELHEKVALLENEAAGHVCAATPLDSTRSVSHESLDELIEREAAWIDPAEEAPPESSHDHSVEAVAHDLRVPLTSIRGFTEILMDHEVSAEERAEFLGIIRSESQRLSRMVNDLLDVRRIKNGAGELELSDVDMRDLVRDALNSLDGLARSRGIGFEGTWARTERTIRGDRDQLHRMVANLLSNAVKFSPDGGTVEVILRDGSEPDGVLLGVRDHGPGISDADQEIVFERFSRGATGSENVSGTGLGLSICREIVAVHGARIWPESRPQSGATLWVEFPPPARVTARCGEASAAAGA